MTKVIIVSQIIILLFTFNCSGRTQLIKDNNRPQNLKKVLAERKARKEKIRKSAPFAYGYQQRRVLRRQHRERLRFGLLRHQRKYKRKKLKNTVLEQRSGHKRLYDHNIFLRALFKGRLVFQKKANLAPQFKNGLFVDIGSAILYQDGAPTVRDL